MDQTDKIATVFGATGFVGRHVVRALARAGYTVRVATRDPQKTYFLKTAGNIAQIVPFPIDPSKPDTIRVAIDGADVVVNLCGILNEGGANSKFTRVHSDLARNIAQFCSASAVDRLVHVSALGVDRATSRYAKSKLAGEASVIAAFPQATILRPSVIFGPEDRFFNLFASLAKRLPFLPLIGGGHTKFQPVYVGDVADAVMAALTLPPVGSRSPLGRVYEIGGPEVLSFRQIYERLFHHTGLRKPLVDVPFAIAKVQGAVLGILPGKMLTADQVESLKTDTIVHQGMPNLSDLGLSPTALDAVLPSYLWRFRPGGRFADKKAA